MLRRRNSLAFLAYTFLQLLPGIFSLGRLHHFFSVKLVSEGREVRMNGQPWRLIVSALCTCPLQAIILALLPLHLTWSVQKHN